MESENETVVSLLVLARAVCALAADGKVRVVRFEVLESAPLGTHPTGALRHAETDAVH